MKKLALSFAALALTASAAFAQAPAFAEVDTDGNGTVSFDELLVVAPGLDEDTFAAFDLNGDGELDEAEFTDFVDTISGGGEAAPDAGDPVEPLDAPIE